MSGVKRQIDALREGFNSVLPLSNLASFSYTEVVNLKKFPCSLLFPFTEIEIFKCERNWLALLSPTVAFALP